MTKTRLFLPMLFGLVLGVSVLLFVQFVMSRHKPEVLTPKEAEVIERLRSGTLTPAQLSSVAQVLQADHDIFDAQYALLRDFATLLRISALWLVAICVYDFVNVRRLLRGNKP